MNTNKIDANFNTGITSYTILKFSWVYIWIYIYIYTHTHTHTHLTGYSTIIKSI